MGEWEVGVGDWGTANGALGASRCGHVSPGEGEGRLT